MISRRRISISSRLMATTTALVVLVVLLSGGLHWYTTNRVFDDAVVRQVNLVRSSMRSAASGQARLLAESSRAALLQNDYSTLRQTIAGVQAVDRANLSFAYVVDPAGRVVAASDPHQHAQPLLATLWAPIEHSGGLLEGEDVGVGGNRVLLFAEPIRQERHRLGTLVLGYSLRILEQQLADLTTRRQLEKSKTLAQTTLLGIAFGILGTLLAIFQASRITRPIKLLARRADQIARGDLETRVEVTTSDELGTLGESFNYMADRLVVLMHETAQKATLDKELEVARSIQEALVPSQDVMEREGLRLAGRFMPASQCGGDWWTYHDLSEGRLLVVIGDVTGHGVPSAMITAAAKASLDTIRAVTGDNLTVTYLLEGLNRAIFESARRKFVMTCFAAIIDVKKRLVTYANAGHIFPYLYREAAQQAGTQPQASSQSQAGVQPEASSQSQAAAQPQAGVQIQTGEAQGQFGCLMTRGNRLGDLAESKYAAKQMELLPGDLLVWYTDGLVECEGPNGEQYGEKRLRAAIRKVAQREPAAIRDTVLADAMQFFGERPRKDDVTMVIARVT